MNQAFVYNSYDFIGFEICNGLLEEGWVVFGESRDLLTHEKEWEEEKRLLIGRNGNFHEVNDTPPKIEEPYTLFIPLYDIYIKEINFAKKELITHPLLSNNPPSSVVFIIPKRMVHVWNKDEIIFNQFCKQHQIQTIKFWAPTVYGRWQPHPFLFAQTLYVKDESCLKNVVDDVTDAIYVNDFVSSMIETIQSNSTGEFLIKSNQEQEWERVAQLFMSKEKIKHFIHTNESMCYPFQHSITVKPTRKIKEITDEYKRINAYESLITNEKH